jgi:hypothetical protein
MRGATDGLTHEAYKFLTEAVGPNYASRFVSAAPLIIEYMDTRVPEELEHYRTAVAVTEILTQRAFSNEVITPGKTTVGDVRWWCSGNVGAQIRSKTSAHDRAEGAKNKIE